MFFLFKGGTNLRIIKKKRTALGMAVLFLKKIGEKSLYFFEDQGFRVALVTIIHKLYSGGCDGNHFPIMGQIS